MTTFTAWKFDDEGSAAQAAVALKAAERDGLVQVHDHAVVTWPKGAAKPEMHHDHESVKRGAGWGALWGMVIGALFLVPVIGGVAGAAIGALSKSTEGAGIKKEDLERIRVYFEAEFERDGAHGLAIFCAGLDNVWRPLPLTEVVPDGIKVGQLLYLAPLVPLVGRGETRVVARVVQHIGDHVGVERPGPRVAEPALDDHAHADTRALRHRQLLDRAAEHLHVGVARSRNVRLDLLALFRARGDRAREVEQTHAVTRRCRRR